MKKHTNEGLDALIYLQERMGVNFTITFLKTTGEWQFAIPTKNAVKIRNRSFDDLISKAEKCMAEAFKIKYGGNYKETFSKDQKISQLEWAVDVLTKENLKLKKSTQELSLDDDGYLTSVPGFYSKEKIADFTKEVTDKIIQKFQTSETTENTEEIFGLPNQQAIIDFFNNQPPKRKRGRPSKTAEFMEIGNPNIPTHPPKRKKGWKQVRNQKKSISNPVVIEEDKIEKEGKYAKLKRRIHKALLKRLRGVTISSPHNWISSADITIQNIEDIDKWKELDPSDYKREYTNARQRLYYTKQQKSIGNKVKPSKKKDKVVIERKYGITDDMIKEEMKRDYENPWKAYKNKNWKKSFKRAKMRLYNNLRNSLNK